MKRHADFVGIMPGAEGCPSCGVLPEHTRRAVVHCIEAGYIDRDNCGPVAMMAACGADPWHGADLAAAEYARKYFETIAGGY